MARERNGEKSNASTRTRCHHKTVEKKTGPCYGKPATCAPVTKVCFRVFDREMDKDKPVFLPSNDGTKTVLNNNMFLYYFSVPGSEDNTREAQDTPVISVESNRNETETREPIRPRKTNKTLKSSKTVDGLVQNTTPNPSEEVTTEANSGKTHLKN